MPFPLRKVPLWSIWVVPFVLQTFTVVGLVGYLSLRNGQRAVKDLAEQLMNKTGQQVDNHLDHYLALPIQLTEMNLRAIALGDLDITNQRASERYFWQQSKTFPNISYIGYTLKDGTEVGAGRWIRGLEVLLYENFPGKNNSSDYLADHSGNRTQRLQTYEYDATQETWYRDAVVAGKPIWTGVDASDYVDAQLSSVGAAIQSTQNLSFSSEGYVAVSAAAPFYDARGRLLGVLGVDLMLTQISKFLSTLELSRGGHIFILEHTPEGFLIGNSTHHPIVYRQDSEIRRHNVSDSPDPLIRAIAPHLQHQIKSDSHHSEETFKIEFNQQRYHIQVKHWQDEKHGMDWLVVISVPESDFMAEIDASTRQTIVLCLGALSLATLLGICTAGWVTHPMRELNRASQAMTTGDLNQQIAESPIQELDAVRQSFNQMATQLHFSFSHMEYTSTHDALTGLLNRAAFRQRLTEVLEDTESRHSSHSFAVLFLDLDFFKRINDSLGHLAGDQLLIAVSQRLRYCVRTQDTLARLGGDEFVLLLNFLEHPSQATQTAERIIAAMKEPFLLNGKTALISTSVGIVFRTVQKNDADSILRNADIALYQAKARGKAVYEVFDDKMHAEVLERLKIETDLGQVLNRLKQETATLWMSDQEEQGRDRLHPLNIHYQPIVDTQTLEISGVEALVRWHHPTLGMISPAKFIPIAEETGLIVPLGYWVLRQACQQMHQWQQQFPQNQPIEISVNLSTRQFLQPDLVEQVAQILDETRIAARSLKLEITESLLMSDRPSMQTRLSQLKELGVQLSLDDFGTGYSSLSYLHHFRLDTLKIDRSFIHQLATDTQTMAIVESIITLAHRLGLNVVAEGVETQSQLKYLRHIALCEQIQGFLIAPAVPAQQMTQWIRNRRVTNIPMAVL